VEKVLFFISCTTCQARLAVRDESAIGAILTCPKCQSMVLVDAPKGWKRGEATDSAKEKPGTGGTHLTPRHEESPPAEGATGQPPPVWSPKPVKSAGPTVSPQSPEPRPDDPGPGPSAKGGAPVNPALADTVDDFPQLQRPSSERSDKARSHKAKAGSRGVIPPPLPPLRAPGPPAATPGSPPAEQIVLGQELGGGAQPTASQAAGVSPPLPPQWIAPAEAVWRRWLILLSAPVAGLALAAVIVYAFSSGRSVTPEPESSAEVPADPAPDGEPDRKPEPPSLPVRLDPRWIPDDVQMLFSVRLARLSKQPEFQRVAGLAEPPWRRAVDVLISHFGLRQENVSRLYWFSTDLAAWADQSVVVIELEEGQDAVAYGSRGEAMDFKLAGATCRCEPGKAWPHPFAVVNPRVLVTGREDLLRHLADRAEGRLRSKPIERMLNGITPDVDAALLVDLRAARREGWRLPTALLDVWPAGRQAWHVAWEVPQGLAVAVRMDGQVRSEVALVCEAETAAEKVHSALDELVPAAQSALAVQLGSLAEKLQAGRIKADVADRYDSLLKQAQAGLKAARWEVADSAVWIRIQWPRSLSDLALAAWDSRAAIEADWLAAARAGDEANHRRILGGLSGYQKAEGNFPAGAVGGVGWAPETRLSWIATMLPYLGQREWHAQLQFGYPWNGVQNRKITQQPLEAVVNPAMGPSTTGAGFPVTHYVGVAGVGADAGKLPADDPRAGIFGFGRSTRPADLARGASNTIAVLGVSGQLGPWASGGAPTVRALTKTPYVNGPDGFGSGQPDGMLAGMADGSVRFVSKDVDARVLEILATVRKGGDVTAAALDPRPSPQAGPAVQGPPGEVPKPKEKPAAAKPETLAEGPAAKPDQAQIEVAQVDVRARLADKIAEVNFPEVPLNKVVEFLQNLSTLRITFDLDAMDQLGVTTEDPITLKLSGTTVGQVLEAALARRGLVYIAEGGQILATRPPKQRETVRYNVSDLVGGDPDALDALAELVARLVSPESWQSSGGQGTIDAQNDTLLVLQTDGVQHQVLTFLEKLRTARGKPLRSQLDPQRVTLDTRRDQARATLARPVTASFVEPAPLTEVVAYLEEIGQTTIVVDWIALAAAGIPANGRGTLKADKQPLSAALDSLLAPMQLAYRVGGADVLQVTTRKEAAARLDLEFYRIGDLLDDKVSPESLIKRIKEQAAAGSWSDAGGPAIHFDAPGKCLIVLQGQPVQSEVQALLEKLRAERKAPAAAP
jgi:hypothetical protein